MNIDVIGPLVLIAIALPMFGINVRDLARGTFLSGGKEITKPKENTLCDRSDVSLLKEKQVFPSSRNG